MAFMRMTTLVLIVACSFAGIVLAQAPADPYQWLEDVTGDRALQWVKQENARSKKELESSPDFEPIRVDLATESLLIEGVVVGVLRREA